MNGSDVVFAGYRLEQRIMADTVSTTYRAVSQSRSRSLRPVALRITEPLDTATDAATAAAFFAALNRAAAVRHPALSVIHGAGEAEGRLYVATDLIAGATLAEYIHHHGPLPAAVAVDLLQPIAEALDHAHAAGLVHGAISPRTIHLPGHGVGPALPPSILTGFGLHTLLAHRVRTDRTTVDVTDVCYVAPEQLGGDGNREARPGPPADQYALACALYHCVAGRPPFVRDSVAGMFGAHLFSVAHVPAGRHGDATLVGAIARGVAKHPGQRHPSCLALMRATGHSLPADQRVEQPPDRDAAPVPGSAGVPSTAQRTGVAHPAPEYAAPRSPARRTRRRRRARRRGPRLPIAWPVAVMLVLAGMVVTLLLAAILGDGYPIGAVGATTVTGRVPAGAVMPGGGHERAWSGGSHWQRALDAGPVTHLRASVDAAVAAAGDTVFTLEPDDGEVRWRSRTQAGEPADVVVSGQTVGVWSARLRGLSLRDGTPRWQHVDVLTPLAAVTASDRAVYGIRQRWTGSELVALDSGSGRPLWRFDGGAVGMSDEAVVGVGDHTVAVLQDGHLFAIDPGRQASGATGMRAARWHREVARPWRTPLVLSDVVIVATRGGRVCAYAAADGAEQWCAQVAGVRRREPAVVASGGVVAVITPSQVTGLTRGSGTQQWVHEAQHALAPIATASGDDVVVTDDTGTLRGLEAGRGRERWRVSGVGRITALTAGDGAIYAGTRDGRVVRVRLERARHDHGHSPVVEAQRDRQS